MARNYPDWIKAYLDYSSNSEAPDKFHLWTAIGTIAGALRRHVWIDQGYFEWTPNFYIIFVAPPGIVSKSTTASIGMNLLRQVPGINFGPDAATWQALAMSFAQATEMFPITNPEGIEELHPMSALTISSSEFGTFLNPHDRELVDLLVSLWDGQRGVWKKCTKTSGDDAIENPWINLIACTTPAWIAGTFPEYMIGGGFTSRCIFVYAEQKRHLVPYPGRVVPKSFKATGEKLIHDLEQISQITGEMSLSEDAVAFGEAWYTDLYENRPTHLDTDRLAGYLARKQTHMHKLAMIICASQTNSLIITEDHLHTADGLLTVIEEDMPHVFGKIGQTEITRTMNSIVVQVDSTNKALSAKEIYRSFLGTIGFKEFEDCLNSVVASGIATTFVRGDSTYVKRDRSVPLDAFAGYTGTSNSRVRETPEQGYRTQRRV